MNMTICGKKQVYVQAITYSTDSVDCLSSSRVVLTHSDQPIVTAVHDRVSETQLAVCFCERPHFALVSSQISLIQPLVPTCTNCEGSTGQLSNRPGLLRHTDVQAVWTEPLQHDVSQASCSLGSA